MIHKTPGGLFPTCLAFFSSSETFVLAHPVADGPVNMDCSVLFRVLGTKAKPIRVFNYEVTGIVAEGGFLYLVDGAADLHVFDGSNWQEYAGVGDGLERINALRTAHGNLYGLAGGGHLYVWHQNVWKLATAPDGDTYFYDLKAAKDGSILVSGDNGFIGEMDNTGIKRIQLDTNVDLTCVLPLDEKLLVTGWRATALLGAGDEFIQVTSDGRSTAFFNAVLWRNRILVAGGDDILEVRDRRLEKFADTPALRLSSEYGSLWLQNKDGVAFLDEGTWRSVELSVDL